jgi:hypothetical protein
MDEARRFLRYVFPGLVYVTETLVGLLLALPHWTVAQMAILRADSVGVALGGLLASGGLGYIFSAIHHSCVWHVPCDRDVLNDLEFIQHLVERELIADPFKGAANRRRTATVTAWALWWERMSNERIRNTNTESSALGDIAHSLGTARIASCFAIATVLLICSTGAFVLEPRPIIGFALMLAALFGTTYSFWDGWVRVGRMTQEIFNLRLERELESEPRLGLATSVPRGKDTEARGGSSAA